MANTSQQKFYSNPAFCQQSEYYTEEHRALSPVRSDISVRQSPLGAQTPVHILDTSIQSVREEPLLPKPKIRQKNDEYEQEFYEEMLVDDTGYIQEKKILVISSPYKEQKNVSNTRTESKYIPIALEENYPRNKARYEYIPTKSQLPQEHVITSPGRVHRYALIPTDDELEQSPKTKGGRYGVPLEEIHNKNRYAYITENDSRYEYIDDERSPPRQSINRTVQRRESYRQPIYEQQNYRHENQQPYQETNYYQQHRPMQKGNPIATKKLHDLLQTPKKSAPRQSQPNTPRQIMSPPTPRKQISPSIIIPKTTPNKMGNPKFQQRLNYNIGPERKHTAIVAPMYSGSTQTVYSETTINKPESWTNSTLKKPGVQGTLAIAALMMLFCGSVTSGLCFYMISILGKLYFLEFGIISGFTCIVLGILGFRTRNCYWLPNRNYISGKYILFAPFLIK